MVVQFVTRCRVPDMLLEMGLRVSTILHLFLRLSNQMGEECSPVTVFLGALLTHLVWELNLLPSTSTDRWQACGLNTSGSGYRGSTCPGAAARMIALLLVCTIQCTFGSCRLVCTIPNCPACMIPRCTGNPS